MGPHRLGCNRRDLPAESPRQGALHDHRHQLALELGHRLLHTLSRQLGPGQCQSPVQDLLHLVRVLLFVYYLRVLYDL